MPKTVFLNQMDIQPDPRKNEEITFHDDLYSSKGTRRTAQNKFYDRRRDEVLINYAFSQIGSLQGKHILFYGAGIDMRSLLLFASSAAKPLIHQFSKSSNLIC